MMKPIQSLIFPFGAVLTVCRMLGKIKIIMPIISTTLPIVIQFMINLYVMLLKILALKQSRPGYTGA